ncbi:(2Fe-2S)-binding protein [Streptomyces sp. P38-E01]|uniref:(2Fe-2S)-binding protein n=1 Tax=Streptomyces tardus TaxID=2780544 RepID=A0A949JT01_9ACTN|nr:(2Fe-2S)-binding protein [Streptomyces tardus]MBU7600691.1 (2Fe-2S)-binding protein [Streptomyces tardus]
MPRRDDPPRSGAPLPSEPAPALGRGPSPAADLGGFFALRTDGQAPENAVPLAELYAGNAAPLAARIARVAARLEAREPRVAASIAQLGLAARLWSLALAVTVVERRLPEEFDPVRLHWDSAGSTPDDLWLAPAPPAPAAPRSHPAAPTRAAARAAHGVGATRAVSRDPSHEEMAAGLFSLVAERHLVPLAAAVRSVTPVSERLLWGNSASALVGSLQQLSAWCEERDRPGDAALARALVDDVLGHRVFRGTGTLSGTEFRRSTCCLYYRAGGGLCGDCVFRGEEGPRPPRAVRSARPG